MSPTESSLNAALDPALDPSRCALVLIDLQQGILGYARGRHDAATVVAHAKRLSDHFHALNAPVVRVRVGWSADGADLLRQPVDEVRAAGSLPADWLDEPAAFPSAPHDLQILKRQWSAFYGTELDLQLRRRGITTIVLAGIATNLGVESTARYAWEHHYALVIAEDACGAPNDEMHDFAVNTIFPRLGRVRSTATVLAALALPTA